MLHLTLSSLIAFLQKRYNSWGNLDILLIMLLHYCLYLLDCAILVQLVRYQAPFAIPLIVQQTLQGLKNGIFDLHAPVNEPLIKQLEDVLISIQVEPAKYLSMIDIPYAQYIRYDPVVTAPNSLHVMNAEAVSLPKPPPKPSLGQILVSQQ